ncbi:TPA: nucleoid-associated protein [Vibrio parahaemolyticus]|uniref:nucleoid-associated protein n=1 Tax=Vibrio alginolyticus TaxID=663 RepID=UPI0006CA65B5|nr:nucleoid-associated protein [Vibrio alginolyticus]KPM86868.1 hypothetical protein AOR09_18055 [Vibrio alginolyticus]KPM96374.1 hypothetical protein AOG25_19860 [Vibrio alginolyticus]MBS9906780.1 nucleoid-associated protein [Vibrio alginolyticus]MBS9984740.1 nucleoid-associated protein [Vibrio alginolyticus]
MHTCTNCSLEFNLSEKECPECQKAVPQTISVTTDIVALHAKTVEIVKSDNGSSLDVTEGKSWPIESDSVSYNFIKDVEQKFRRKNKFHSYYDKDSGEITEHLTQYTDSEFPVESFNTLVSAMLSSLKDKIFDVLHSYKSSTLVFMHYKSSEAQVKGRLLIVMVDRKEGFNFTEDERLYPKSATHINLSALKQAVMIDLDAYSNSFPNVPDSNPYLKFIIGNSSAEFFRKAMGCDEKVDNGQSLENVYTSIFDFKNEHNLNDNFVSTAITKLEMLIDCVLDDKTRSAFSLNEVETVVNEALPYNSPAMDSFSDFVNNRELPINHFIEPTRAQAENQRWLDLSSKQQGLVAKIMRQDIYPANNGQDVEFDETQSRLSFRITDSDLIDRIKSLMKND